MNNQDCKSYLNEIWWLKSMIFIIKTKIETKVQFVQNSFRHFLSERKKEKKSFCVVTLKVVN